MMIYAPLKSKQDRIEPTRCEVDCVVEIPYDEFILFRDNPLKDYDFIKTHLDELKQKDYSTASCMLVIGKNQSDGILVDPQGYSYERYTAYIPEARQLLQHEQSPALSLFSNRMRDLVEKILENARVIDASVLGSDTVGLLRTVEMTNLGNNAKMTYTIVNPHEANLKEGKISIKSPIAEALLGRKIGETVEAKVPSGVLKLRIDNITL